MVALRTLVLVILGGARRSLELGPDAFQQLIQPGGAVRLRRRSAAPVTRMHRHCASERLFCSRGAT